MREGDNVIIAILNQKGGTGKTTLSINIAAALVARGGRVLLVDADPQHSALDWQAARTRLPLFSVVGIPSKALRSEIGLHQGDYDHIIIDGPPRVNEIARQAIAAADVVLIPVQPSPYDVWAAKEIVDLIGEAGVYKPCLKAYFVINRKIVITAIGRDVAGALAGYTVPVLTATVGQRISFAESAASGSTVLEADPRSRAAAEINAVVSELLEGK
jgi:chromosome partitioning protein